MAVGVLMEILLNIVKEAHKAWRCDSNLQSETINDPPTDRGRCQEILSHLKSVKMQVAQLLIPSSKSGRAPGVCCCLSCRMLITLSHLSVWPEMPMMMMMYKKFRGPLRAQNFQKSEKFPQGNFLATYISVGSLHAFLIDGKTSFSQCKLYESLVVFKWPTNRFRMVGKS